MEIACMDEVESVKLMYQMTQKTFEELTEMLTKNEYDFDEQIRGVYTFITANKSKLPVFVNKRRLAEVNQGQKVVDSSLSRKEILDLIITEIEWVYSRIHETNNQESQIIQAHIDLPALPKNRSTNDSDISQKELEEVYLKIIILVAEKS